VPAKVVVKSVMKKSARWRRHSRGVGRAARPRAAAMCFMTCGAGASMNGGIAPMDSDTLG